MRARTRSPKSRPPLPAARRHLPLGCTSPRHSLSAIVDVFVYASGAQRRRNGSAAPTFPQTAGGSWRCWMRRCGLCWAGLSASNTVVVGGHGGGADGGWSSTLSVWLRDGSMRFDCDFVDCGDDDMMVMRSLCQGRAERRVETAGEVSCCSLSHKTKH